MFLDMFKVIFKTQGNEIETDSHLVKLQGMCTFGLRPFLFAFMISVPCYIHRILLENL